MNLFVADSHWGWWIILYFYLGGIAAGAYFMATLMDLVGNDQDRELARVSYWIAFPLIAVCGLFLTLDLHQPLRFWHMLFKSEVVHQALAEGWPTSGSGWRLLAGAPLLKYWSPMSAGSWALLLFGLCSLLSLLGTIWPGGRLARLLREGIFGKILGIVGSGVGFFVASYTGVLLTATNQPVWSDSALVGALFLTSAASTGIAAMVLLAHWRRIGAPEAHARLDRADRWALSMEMIVFALFLISLGAWLVPVLHTWQGWVLVAGTLGLGLLAPLVIVLSTGSTRRGLVVGSVLVLTGGFLLRYGIVTTPPALLKRGPAMAAGKENGEGKVGQILNGDLSVMVGFSPEDGRPQGDGPGADPGNRPAELRPRSKVFNEK